MVRAVVFDFDGVILDTEWVEYVSIAEVFTEHGTELSLDLWTGFIGTVDHPHWTEILADQLGRPVDREALVAERRRRNRPHLEALVPNPGVVELLDALDAAGIPVAVASSSPRSWVEGHLGRLGLLDRFVAVRTGDDVARTKPHPDVYLAALEAVGVADAAHRAVAIEDSHNGCRAATAAGMVAVGVPTPMTAAMDFSMAALVVESLLHLDVDRLGGLVDAA